VVVVCWRGGSSRKQDDHNHQANMSSHRSGTKDNEGAEGKKFREVLPRTHNFNFLPLS